MGQIQFLVIEGTVSFLNLNQTPICSTKGPKRRASITDLWRITETLIFRSSVLSHGSWSCWWVCRRSNEDPNNTHSARTGLQVPPNGRRTCHLLPEAQGLWKTFPIQRHLRGWYLQKRALGLSRSVTQPSIFFFKFFNFFLFGNMSIALWILLGYIYPCKDFPDIFFFYSQIGLYIVVIFFLCLFWG